MRGGGPAGARGCVRRQHPSLLPRSHRHPPPCFPRRSPVFGGSFPKERVGPFRRLHVLHLSGGVTSRRARRHGVAWGPRTEMRTPCCRRRMYTDGRGDAVKACNSSLAHGASASRSCVVHTFASLLEVAIICLEPAARPCLRVIPIPLPAATTLITLTDATALLHLQPEHGACPLQTWPFHAKKKSPGSDESRHVRIPQVVRRQCVRPKGPVERQAHLILGSQEAYFSPSDQLVAFFQIPTDCLQSHAMLLAGLHTDPLGAVPPSSRVCPVCMCTAWVDSGNTRRRR